MEQLLRVALLDDNAEQLEKNQHYLEGLPVTVVAAHTEAKSFCAAVQQVHPDVLLLDLNLGDTYMTGMEVAYGLQLPVLFVSSNTPEYVRDMERLKRDYSICVDHLTKPFTASEFQKTVARFLTEVRLFSAQQHVHLDLGSSKRVKIALDRIIYLAADKAMGSESNNKIMYFIDRKPEALIDFSFVRMEEKGLTKQHFLTIHKSFRVNIKHIRAYHRKTESLEVEVMNANGKMEIKFLPVSENYQSAVKQWSVKG